MITQARLKELLTYCSETGVFRWNVSRGRGRAGEIAGSLFDKERGHLGIKIDGKTYQSSRLAWLYVYGQWPNGELDHKNRRPGDNRISNLREATPWQNQVNKGNQINNTSGLSGVYRHKRTGKWHARVTVRRKSIHLGCFDSKEEAITARLTGASLYYGEFSPTKQAPSHMPQSHTDFSCIHIEPNTTDKEL